jgi:hypothetical protein
MKGDETRRLLQEAHSIRRYESCHSEGCSQFHLRACAISTPPACGHDGIRCSAARPPIICRDISSFAQPPTVARSNA